MSNTQTSNFCLNTRKRKKASYFVRHARNIYRIVVIKYYIMVSDLPSPSSPFVLPKIEFLRGCITFSGYMYYYAVILCHAEGCWDKVKRMLENRSKVRVV